MNTKLRILILEDVPEDAELIKRILSKAKLQFTARTVDNKKDFLKELKDFLPDIILSDYTMPEFTGLEALEIVKEVAPSIPFIIVTGSINEETAVECIKAGAVDYVLKDRLIRIGPAVEAALENKRIRDEKARVEKALSASAREWKTTFDAINNAVCLLDMEGNVLRCNTAMKNLVGKPFGEIIGKGCSGLFRDVTSPDILSPFVRMHESRRRETTLVELNNRWLDILVDPILDEAGALIGGVQIISDVTERRKAEDALKKSAQLLRDTGEMAKVGAWEFDLSTKNVLMTEEVCRIHGVEPGYKPTLEEAMNFYAPESIPALEEALKKATETGEPYDLETLFIPSGSKDKIWVRSLGKAVYIGGKIVKLAGTFQNIDKYKRAEEALKAERQRLHDMLEAIPIMVCLLTPDYHVAFANRTFREKFGESHGRRCYEYCFGEKEPCDFCETYRVLKTAKPHHWQVTTPDGASAIDVYDFPFTDVDGSPMILEMDIDITERKRAEEERRISEERYLQLFNEAPIGYQELDIKGKIVRVNKTQADMMGYTIDEMVGKTIFDFISLDQQEEAKNRYKERIQKQLPSQGFERKYITKSGKYIYFSVTDKLVIDEKGQVTGIRSTLQDITEHKQEEEEEDRIRLETAIENLAEYIVITDKEGTIQYVNPAFEKITGYTREEAIGKNPRMLKSGKHDEVFYKTLWDTLLSGKTWKGHLINRKKDESIFEEEASISPIKDSSGNITNFVAVKRDVTNEVMIEQRLFESQKLEAIGTLAGGIAHDFNNILSAIIGYTELSIDTVPEGSQIHSDLTKIFKAGYRARDLVNQILTFSRQREQGKRPILIAPIVKESLKLLRASLPSTVEIRQNIEPGPGMVMADATQIHQVIMNLCTNAGHAMQEKGGILEVSLTSEELDSEFCLQHPGLTPGLYLKLMVSDTGHGIEPDTLPRIFEPYFTTKEKSGGTGLGLSVVHGIVTGFGGAVTVYSEPGKGTTFKVYLPTTTEEAVAEIEKMPSVTKGHERILLIDDEPDIIDVGKRILEQLGYTVTTNSSSMDALELFQKDPYQFDLVISDMTMPFMTGDELAGEFMRIRQDIPIIICTGFSEKLTEEKALSIGIRAYLGKPLLKSEMAETVRRVLDQKSEDV